MSCVCLSQLRNAQIEDIFINFHIEGESQTSSVNGRNFIFPSFPSFYLNPK